MTEQTQPLTQLPTALAIDNAIMAPAVCLTPIWWLSMLISDARDRRRHCWRKPTLPRSLTFDVPNGMAPIDISHYLNGLGIQTATTNLQWAVSYGQIGLIKSILVPGRNYDFARYALDRLLAGNPVPQRGPGIANNNIEMVLSDAFGRIVGEKTRMIGKTPKQAEKALKGKSLRQRITDALD